MGCITALISFYYCCYYSIYYHHYHYYLLLTILKIHTVNLNRYILHIMRSNSLVCTGWYEVVFSVFFGGHCFAGAGSARPKML